MASEYQYPGRSQGGKVEGQRRVSTRTLTSANLEAIAEELLFGSMVVRRSKSFPRHRRRR